MPCDRKAAPQARTVLTFEKPEPSSIRPVTIAARKIECVGPRWKLLLRCRPQIKKKSKSGVVARNAANRRTGQSRLSELCGRERAAKPAPTKLCEMGKGMFYFYPAAI